MPIARAWERGHWTFAKQDFGDRVLEEAVTYALRRTSAGRLASLTYLIPVVAMLLGWVLLGETPPRLAAFGGALCLAGVYLARRP